MENMGVGEKETRTIKELSEMLHSPKSEVIRMAVAEGVKTLRMKIAMEKYVNEEFSLCRAAEFAGVSIQQMARYMAERGIPFFKYSIAEAERDTKEAVGWLRDAYSR
ncbi:MAG: UPF0175 family protein [Euryarchaeota archaeon]|nr:UPF0175 family protein [Euryarchaeota archaeon]